MNKIYSKLVKYKVILIQKFSRVILGNLSGNVPGSVINSIEENLYNPVIKEHVNQVMAIADPCVATYPFQNEYASFFRRNKSFDKKNLYLLKNVCVSPFSGLAWINKNYFLVESVGSLFRMIGWNNVLHEPLLKHKQLEEDNYVVCCPNQVYYHWLFESLPGILMAIDTIPSTKILISDKCPSYCLEMLSLIYGEQEFEKRVLIADGVRLVPRLITLQQEPDAGFVHPVVIKNLQEVKSRLLSKADNYSTNPCIYISRRKAKNRKLTGEAEVEQALQKLGFDVVFCEDLSIIQQMKMFSQAECLITPHGAALSNLVWANHQVTVLEIFPYAYFNDCFARLAVSLGLSYSYTYAENDKNSYGKIDVTTIVELAQKMLQEKAPMVFTPAEEHAEAVLV